MLSPDIMKINMDYIHKSEDSYHFQEYLKTLAKFAERIGVEVLYEGVETKRQVDICMSSGGRYYQGYIFAEPQPTFQQNGVNWTIFLDSNTNARQVKEKKSYSLNFILDSLDNTLDKFFYEKKYTFEEDDLNLYLAKLCQTLPDFVKKLVLCNIQGWQLSQNIIKNSCGQIEKPSGDGRYLTWRGYFLDSLKAFNSGQKSFISNPYRDIITKNSTYTYSYRVSKQLVLIIDIVYNN
jgi:hypothetical protein